MPQPLIFNRLFVPRSKNDFYYAIVVHEPLKWLAIVDDNALVDQLVKQSAHCLLAGLAAPDACAVCAGDDVEFHVCYLCLIYSYRITRIAIICQAIFDKKFLCEIS